MSADQDRKIWVLQKELENQIINRVQDSREARNRLIGITIVALIEFLWILLRPACGV